MTLDYGKYGIFLIMGNAGYKYIYIYIFNRISPSWQGAGKVSEARAPLERGISQGYKRGFGFGGLGFRGFSVSGAWLHAEERKDLALEGMKKEAPNLKA